MLSHEEIQEILEEKFDQLCKQYNITNCKLMICDWFTFLEEMYDIKYKKYCRTPKQLMGLVSFDASLYNSSPIFTVYGTKRKNELVHRIVFPSFHTCSIGNTIL